MAQGQKQVHPLIEEKNDALRSEGGTLTKAVPLGEKRL
jgi:hypothetical protein